ncbi:hypothetical protein SS1G_11403 [Sclerotinia sclerotiorum 1980 UF-70]|uniref:Rhodopsin domain-containing protein n=2 Tax=Sclerotinia sclerotiorum (strain ATCC 18683 / 1980 / Ss-1) TaxID=665079 RepID=A7F1D3_SCLS1|nr:hypothetical protein SS1G_11403 [Sclerotinia sclerotiorum 1980 UF-70]APA11193.1 hypothetical protein sscle_07g059630 [Sclerotinia sclerotiorum 1980 UF-70]EDN95525.1 hypothetical protein SS1G_11403 [Sclerotinia sclerotiorum 1980 UF-70]
MTVVPLQPSGEEALRVSSSMITLVFIALILRFIARFKARAGFLLEDGLALLAAAFFYVDQGLFLYGEDFPPQVSRTCANIYIQAVLGKGSSGGSDARLMLLPQLDRFFRILYIEEIIFVITITVVKLSILTFYRHIFTTRKFKFLTWTLCGICIVWAIVCIFVVIFQCKPIHAFWKFELQLTPGAAKCMPSGQVILGFEVSNLLIDFLILSLPVYMVQKLQLKTSRKISIIGIFLLGSFVCITCIVRAYFIFDPKTKQPPMDWTTVELASAILCACLPTYGPLLSGIDITSSTVKSWFSSLIGSKRNSQNSKATNPSSKSNHSRYNQLEDSLNKSQKFRTNSKPSTSEEHLHAGGDYQMNNIMVERSVEVV